MTSFQAPATSSPGIACWIAASLFGLFLYGTLPAGVAVYNDDFGYLRSVLETLEHGRPWTNDWLEPWAASFSTLSALVFLAGGDARLAMHGLLGLLGAVGFAAGCALWKARGHRAAPALALAALVSTVPTLLWKSVEFTAFALHLPCLLLALRFSESRRWGWFLVVWLTAVANRQSAIAWVTLPGLEFLRAGFAGDFRRARRSALVAVAGLGAYALLAATMNETHAQRLITNHLIERLEPALALRRFAIGALLFLVAAGVGATVARVPPRTRAAGLPRLSWVLLAVLALPLLLLDVGSLVPVEHVGYDGRSGWVYGKLIPAIALAGWWTRRFRISADKAACALASLALVSLRAQPWDYYFTEVAICGLFGVLPAAGAPVSTPMTARWRPAVWLPLALVALCHLRALWRHKLILDRGAAICALCEHARRAGRLDVSELTGATFGFLGWHLHPYFIAHEGKDDADLASFTRYLAPPCFERFSSRASLARGRPRGLELATEPAAGELASGVFPEHWVFEVRHTLRRTSPPGGAIATPIRRAEYRAQEFPLTDEEWSTLFRQAMRR